MRKNMERLAAPLLALVSAAAVLMIATSSSPLYATNFWTDTNIYFTIGRGMVSGLMPYRDLFDHKGPLLYMMYALAALVSDTGFIGVFLLQVASLWATLMLAYKTVELYGKGWLNLLVIPVMAMVTTASVAFNQGGSAEEFNLPALMLALYAMLRRFEEGEACKSPARLYAAFGFAMGWVFLIKYTNCGLFFGLAAMALCYEWRLRGFKKAFGCGLWALAGMALLVAPVALYLLANGALRECIEVYFYENIFIYGGEPMTLGEHVYNALAYLRTQSMANPVMAGLAIFGCAFMAARAVWRRQRGFLFEALAAPAAAGLLLLFTYWGEMAHPYYAAVFAALVPLGLCPVALLARKLRSRRWGLVSLVPLAACVPVCLALCAAVPLMEIEREDMTQVWFGEIISQTEGATMLDWTSLDQGFYLAAGVTPTCRYFVNTNLDSEDKKLSYEEYLASGEVDYIVSTNGRPEPGENYQLVAMEEGVFDLNATHIYKLYEYVGESNEEE